MSVGDRLRIMHVYEEGDYTCDEVEVITGIDHQTCSARIKDLKDDGMLSIVPDSQRLTRRGKPADVLTRTPKAASTSQEALF